jgi:hypothetical protein
MVLFGCSAQPGPHCGRRRRHDDTSRITAAADRSESTTMLVAKVSKSLAAGHLSRFKSWSCGPADLGSTAPVACRLVTPPGPGPVTVGLSPTELRPEAGVTRRDYTDSRLSDCRPWTPAAFRGPPPSPQPPSFRRRGPLSGRLGRSRGPTFRSVKGAATLPK